jgi:hypothetical protein
MFRNATEELYVRAFFANSLIKATLGLELSKNVTTNGLEPSGPTEKGASGVALMIRASNSIGGHLHPTLASMEPDCALIVPKIDFGV